MEIFYCNECEQWFDIGDAHHKKLTEANMVDPESYTDELYCDMCDTQVQGKHIVDNPLELLNAKKVRLPWI